MKKYTRNILIIALVAVLFVPTLLLLGGCPASYSQDGIHYTIYDDYAEVNYFTCYEGATVCEVPSHVEYDGKVYPVTAVCPDYRAWGGYSFVEGSGYVVEIILPETVTDFRYNEYASSSYPQDSDFNRLEKITVHADNPVYSDVDGVLFTKDKTELLYYPYARPDVEFTFPKEATTIADDSILWQNKIVEEIKVEEGSETFGAVDGVLYSADLGELMYYPLNKQDETFVVPKDMQVFNLKSKFWNNEYITTLEVDESNKHFKVIDNILYSYDGSELVYRLRDSVIFVIPSTVTVVSYNALPGVNKLYVPKSVTLFLECFVDCQFTIRNIDRIYFESDVLPNYLTMSYFRGTVHLGVTLKDFTTSVK